MTTIEIRDVPDEVVEVLRRQAEAVERSLEVYLREQFTKLARQS